MKKLKGFTLAEVLITITMIGIIASMTLPALNNNVQRQQAGPALMKAINSLESANKAAIQDNGVRHLAEINGVSHSWFYLQNVLARYANTSMVPFPENGYVGMAELGEGQSRIGLVFATQDGLTYFGIPDRNGLGIADGRLSDSQFGQFYTVYVDVNGSAKGPNIMGRDLFVLIVDSSGEVLPKGSSGWATYIGGENQSWETTCTNLSENNQDPSNCAGSIAENNGRIIYKF